MKALGIILAVLGTLIVLKMFGLFVAFIAVAALFGGIALIKGIAHAIMDVEDFIENPTEDKPVYFTAEEVKNEEYWRQFNE